MAIGTTLKIGFDGTSVQRGLLNVSKSIASIGKNAALSIVRPFAQLTAMLAPAALVGGMVAFGKASSEAAANIENMRAQFDLFTGSQSGTEKLIKDLRKIAVESPLELTDISDGARNLLTYGVAAEKVAGIVNQLSEVSAGSAERFGRISYAFGQIESIGRLMGTELRQLTEAGFNPLEFISKKTGESMIVLKKRMEDGGIGVDEVREALKAATSAGGRFYGMNEKMAQTFTGRVSIMKDQWSQLLQGFGSGMNDGLKEAVNAITASLPQFLEKFQTIGAYFGRAIADAVSGDYEKFVAIGDLIGTAVGVGLKTSFMVSGTSILDWWAEGVKKVHANMWTPGGTILNDVAGRIQSAAPASRDILDANMVNSGLQGKAQAITGAPVGYQPTPQSAAFIEDSLRVFAAKMDQIEQNTRKAATTGGKM